MTSTKTSIHLCVFCDKSKELVIDYKVCQPCYSKYIDSKTPPKGYEFTHSDVADWYCWEEIRHDKSGCVFDLHNTREGQDNMKCSTCGREVYFVWTLFGYQGYENINSKGPCNPELSSSSSDSESVGNDDCSDPEYYHDLKATLDDDKGEKTSDIPEDSENSKQQQTKKLKVEEKDEKN